jgi:prevent-host-death family protein
MDWSVETGQPPYLTSDVVRTSFARMKTVSVLEAKTHLSALLEEVREGGAEVVITRRGEPVARLCPIAPARVEREPGDWRRYPGWENFVFDPAVFAPMTEEEMKAEGWPV